MLVVRDIDVSYGELQALRGVSLRVEEGEIVCLLGGNASGKSTTMKTILGLLRPWSGSISFRGERIDGMSTRMIIRRGVASVPEGRRLFPQMTVQENLFIGAYLRRDAAEIAADAEHLLQIFPRLGERMNQLAGTLSGGEQQMLSMARALMSRPRLICMDEPSMGLSPAFVDRTFELIREINATGVSVFVVEQNAHRALQVASRAYVLRNGEIVLEGSAEKLARDPAVRSAYLGETVPQIPGNVGERE